MEKEKEKKNRIFFHTARLLLKIPIRITMVTLTLLLEISKTPSFYQTKHSLWPYNKGLPLWESPSNRTELCSTTIPMGIITTNTNEMGLLSSPNSWKLAFIKMTRGKKKNRRKCQGEKIWMVIHSFYYSALLLNIQLTWLGKCTAMFFLILYTGKIYPTYCKLLPVYKTKTKMKKTDTFL